MSRANYLASPPLVVAYALAGNMDIDLSREPVGFDPNGLPVMLRDIWPSPEEITEAIRSFVSAEMFRKEYAAVFEGDEEWKGLPVPKEECFTWDPSSTYVKHPPFFTDLPAKPVPPRDLEGLRVLASLGDSVTTDHISPAGDIPEDGPAGKYLAGHGVAKKDFNSYGSRRGNHEVMMRGTFANIRLRNLLVPGTEGGWTSHLPDGEKMTIYDAAMRYQTGGVPLLVIAGKDYGVGSSRDWAAKGPKLLGVQAVLAESFERIHRSNLVGMGILPLQFESGARQGVPGAYREGDIRDRGDLRRDLAGKAPVRAGLLERDGEDVSRDRPNRHSGGGPVLQQRRNPALCAAAARGAQGKVMR